LEYIAKNEYILKYILKYITNLQYISAYIIGNVGCLKQTFWLFIFVPMIQQQMLFNHGMNSDL